MPKFLKAVHPQDSPDIPASPGKACEAGEWVTAGSFAMCDLAEGYLCDPPCGCDSTFLAPDCRARCVIAETADIDAAALEAIKAELMGNLMRAQQTPDEKDARRVAEKEISDTCLLAASFPAAMRIRVKRTASADGAVEEKYDQLDRVPQIPIEP